MGDITSSKNILRPAVDTTGLPNGMKLVESMKISSTTSTVTPGSILYFNDISTYSKKSYFYNLSGEKYANFYD